MSAGVSSGGDPDLATIAYGGENYIARMTEMAIAKQQLADALRELDLGRTIAAAQKALDKRASEIAALQDKADSALAAAQGDAVRMREEARDFARAAAEDREAAAGELVAAKKATADAAADQKAATKELRTATRAAEEAAAAAEKARAEHETALERTRALEVNYMQELDKAKDLTQKLYAAIAALNGG